MARRSPRKKEGVPPPPRRSAAPPPVNSAKRSSAETRRLLVVSGIAALVILAIVLGIVLTRGGSASSATGRTIDWANLGALQTGPPPWNNGSGTLSERLSQLGLHDLSQEGTSIHIHAHLDVWVDGKKVTVPAGVGIAADNSFLTELHTHDTRGVLHVESPSHTTFTLGQFFGEWDVKLTPKCISTFCGKLTYYVDGQKAVGNPAQLTLKAHQEIALVFGPKPAKIPSSYAFQPGE